MTNKKFCIVGYGNHTKNKLIPLFEKNNIDLSIVTKKKLLKNKFKIYSNIKNAIANEEKNTSFIICSPPHIHTRQSELLIKSGYNVFIEKPICTKVNDLKKILNLAKSNKTFLVESMMFKYSIIYKKFINIFQKNKKNLSKVDIVFTIPRNPLNTFRKDNLNYNVNLFDIGCYPIALMNNIFSENKFKILKIKNVNSKNKQTFFLKVKKKNIEIKIKFGVDKNYENKIYLELNNKKKYEFYPFFFGREGYRYIIMSSKNKQIIKKILEKNSFINMFNLNRKFWLNTQIIRNKEMLKNIISLADLNYQYKKNT